MSVAFEFIQSTANELVPKLPMGVALCRIADDEHSVLPPPPRYPSQAAYNLAVQNGMAMPMVETNNLLKHPEGLQLLAGEGEVPFAGA